MAWACRHFRVVVESLQERVGIKKGSQAHTESCDLPSFLFLPSEYTLNLQLMDVRNRKTGSPALMLFHLESKGIFK